METYRLWSETETKSIYKKAYFGTHIQKGKTTDVGNVCLYHMLDDLDNSATIWLFQWYKDVVRCLGNDVAV